LLARSFKSKSIEKKIFVLDQNRYYTHSDALECLRFISGTKLDERIIRADLDPGYLEGRQYGRGKSGGQVRL
jgi:hypothetical protein